MKNCIIIPFLVVFFLSSHSSLLVDALAFSTIATAATVARPSISSKVLRLPSLFVKRSRSKQKNREIILPSVSEFNALCRKAVEEERRTHYYPYMLMVTGSREAPRNAAENTST